MNPVLRKFALGGAALAFPALALTSSHIFSSAELAAATSGSPKMVEEADAQADYVFDAPLIRGIWYGTRGTNDVHGNINLWEINLSNNELDDEPGSTYYQIQFFGPAPESLADIRPADGTYTVTAELTRENMTINPYSNFKILDGAGRVDMEGEFSSGTMTIATEDRHGEKYMNYVADLTDTKGETHHVTYSSRFVIYEDASQGPGDLEKDLDVTAKNVEARFNKLEGDVMQVGFMFTTQEFDGDEYIRDGMPYTEIIVESYMPFGVDGVSNGVYNITPDFGASYTLQDGEIVEQAGVRYAVGTYIQYVGSGQDLHWGAVSEGTMTVSGEGDQRTVVCDFKTLEGFSVKAVYNGPINISKLPASMLTEDRVLDLTDAEVVATAVGDPGKENRQEWFITFMPTGDHKDGFQTYISSNDRWFYQGISSDVYTPCPTKNLWSSEYLKGYQTDKLLAGTWYLSDFDDDGIPHLYAPAMAGDLEITNHGDDTYTFKFNFDDGLNHHWSGEWNGKPTMVCQDPLGPGSGVEGIADSAAGMNVDGRHVTFAETVDLKVWDAQGRLLVDGNKAEITLPGGGIWLLSVNGKVLKINVR